MCFLLSFWWLQINAMLEEKRQWTDQISGLERRCASVNDENRRLKEENERLRDELQFLRSEVSRVLAGWLQRGMVVHYGRSSCLTFCAVCSCWLHSSKSETSWREGSKMMTTRSGSRKQQRASSDSSQTLTGQPRPERLTRELDNDDDDDGCV